MKVFMKQLVRLAVVLGLGACKMIVDKPSADYDPPPVLDKPLENLVKEPLKQWSLSAMGMAEGEMPKSHAKTRVAILSTGLDYLHPDLQGRFQLNQNELMASPPSSPERTNGKDDDRNGLSDDFVGYDFVDLDGLAYDYLGWGTALAGIIAAKHDQLGIDGVADGVTILPFRVIDKLGQGDPLRYYDALERALEEGVDIILLHAVDFVELEDFELEMFDEVLTKLLSRNVPVVLGAGNSNQEFGQSPFSKMLVKFPNVFPVAALAEAGHKSLLSNFSSQYVLTAAPGEEVLSTWLNGTYQKVSSSTIAAAHVAGALAIATAQKGSRSVLEWRQAIVDGVSEDANDQLFNTCLSGAPFNLAKFLEKL